LVLGHRRRKTAIARVRIRPGSGNVTINGKSLGEYFVAERDRAHVAAVLDKAAMKNSIDVFVTTHGGGTTGQAGAVVMGLARAIIGFDPSSAPAMRDGGFVTRDPREVERKKYGQAGARRRFQFSKR